MKGIDPLESNEFSGAIPQVHGFSTEVRGETGLFHDPEFAVALDRQEVRALRGLARNRVPVATGRLFIPPNTRRDQALCIEASVNRHPSSERVAEDVEFAAAWTGRPT